MAIRDGIVKWVFASACKHFTDNISGLTTLVEGADRPTGAQTDWCEIRVDGPWIREISKDYLKISTEINILVGTVFDPTNLYHESENINKIVAAFTDFDVYKYGDDSSLICRLKLKPLSDLRERLEISKFGRIDPAIPLLQSTIEGHYQQMVDND